MIAFKSFYEQIAPVYESVNRIVTLGLDRVWRREVALKASNLPGDSWLDVCCGTGETALAIATRNGHKKRVFATDFSVAMLSIMKRKQPKRPVPAVAADCASLPFRSNTLDGISITFAARNLDQSPGGLPRYLSECYRVLNPGGSLLILETSQPKSRLIRCLFHWFVRLTVVPLSRLVSPVTSPYRYLAASITRFHDAESLSHILKKCGFLNVRLERFTLGAVALHAAQKPSTDREID